MLEVSAMRARYYIVTFGPAEDYSSLLMWEVNFLVVGSRG